ALQGALSLRLRGMKCNRLGRVFIDVFRNFIVVFRRALDYPFSMIAKYPRAALLIESSRGYGRGLLRGIADYVRVHGPWSIYLQRHHLYDATPAWLKDWRGDGIIARVENRPIARSIRCRRLPAVDLRGRLLDLDVPAILTDDAAG